MIPPHFYLAEGRTDLRSHSQIRNGENAQVFNGLPGYSFAALPAQAQGGYR